MSRKIKKKKSHLSKTDKYFRVLLFLGTIIFLWFLLHNRQYFYRFEHFGYVGLFLINIISNATVFVPLPSIVTVFIGGAVWNPFLVGVISGIGSSIGELVGFFLGFGGRSILNNLNGQQKVWMKRIEKWFKRSGFITIFIASALPDPFFDLVGILAGTLNYSIWKFFLATVFGRICRNLIIAWSGAKIII